MVSRRLRTACHAQRGDDEEEEEEEDVQRFPKTRVRWRMFWRRPRGQDERARAKVALSAMMKTLVR